LAVTVASFKAAYPEFAKAGDPMIAAHLAHVELEVSDSFGDQRDQAVMLRLADTLALSSFGRNARLVAPTDGATTYGQRFRAMAEANAVSASRLGSPARPVGARTVGSDDGL